jgi:hypothetical protein
MGHYAGSGSVLWATAESDFVLWVTAGISLELDMDQGVVEPKLQGPEIFGCSHYKALAPSQTRKFLFATAV